MGLIRLLQSMKTQELIETQNTNNNNFLTKSADGTLPIAQGGTGASTAEQALANLGGLPNTPLVWRDVSFINSWSNIGGDFDTAQYAKDALGFVHIKGVVHWGQDGGILTLPAGCRPYKNVVIPVSCVTNNGYATAYLLVQSNGTLYVYLPVAYANLTRVDLGYINFYSGN